MEIGVYREPSVPRRKSAGATCKVFDVPKKTEFLAVGTMSGPDHGRMLHERFRSELVAVRGLLQKAAAALPPSSPAPSAPRGKDTTRLFLAAAEEPLSKRRKASPPPVVERREAPKKMTPAEREDLAADLEELPAHIVQLLKKQSHGCRGGEIVIDVHSMEGAALVGLKMQLEKFARERNPTPQDSKMVDEEAEEDIDIVGGVSPLVIAPPPLQLAEEEDEYVDICGDERVSSPASPEPSPEVAENAEALERRRRQEEREQAREKLVEMERTAMGGMNSIHPMVLQRLGIVQNQHMVSPASCLRRLGLFLKADDDDGVEEGLEEGEILL